MFVESSSALVNPVGGSKIIEDSRAMANPSRIALPHLHDFRCRQMKEGIDTHGLSDIQWGLVPLGRCHHISMTASSKEGPLAYRVRICKTCCQETGHIELGTYADQESAILVNDVFEILSYRYDKLLVLRPQDLPQLDWLMCRKVDRTKGKEYTNILELLQERLSAAPSVDSSGKKRKSPSFALEDGGRGAKGPPASSPVPNLSSSSSITSEESVSNVGERSGGAAAAGEEAGESSSAEDDGMLEGESGEEEAERMRTHAHGSYLTPSSPVQEDSAHVMHSLAYPPSPPQHSNPPFHSQRARSYTWGGREGVDMLTLLAEEVDVADQLLRLCGAGEQADCLLADSSEAAAGACAALPPPSSAKEAKISSSLAGADDTAASAPSPPPRRRGRAHSMSIIERLPPQLHAAWSAASSADSMSSPSPSPFSLPLPHPLPAGYIGVYSPLERRKRLEKFWAKRNRRVWEKKVKYDVRKNFADSRVRVKGRFVKKEEEQDAIVLGFREKILKVEGGLEGSVKSEATKGKASKGK